MVSESLPRKESGTFMNDYSRPLTYFVGRPSGLDSDSPKKTVVPFARSYSTTRFAEWLRNNFLTS